MLIIAIRTDKPEAELGLFEDKKRLACESWLAHRELAETIHKKIDGILKSQQKNLHDIQGIVVFKGPGSFTGLRIGITVANALAYSLHIPVVSSQNDDWATQGIAKLASSQNEGTVLPEYGSEPHITQQKH